MEEAVLLEALARAKSRGQVKALGRTLDGDPEARRTAERVAGKRGILGVAELDGRRLVKALLNRAGGAQVRTNPIHRDEGFVCIACGRTVEPGGSRVRDHCPHCLIGRHVDLVPGDRASRCMGALEPIDFALEGRAGVVISYRCQRCAETVRNRAHPDDVLPEGLHTAEQEHQLE